MKLIKEQKAEYVIKCANDVYRYLKEFKNEDREYFIVLGLNTKNKVLYREIVHIGTLNGSIIHPRETFKKAIIMSCNSIIIAHNHPSGDTAPSEEDIKITKTMKKAGELLQIKVLDHIIIGDEYYSFQESESI